MPSHFENLTRRYFKYFVPKEQCVYNYRPKWLLNQVTGHALEIDIFFPKKNLAIEVNGFHHGLKDVKSRDTLKSNILLEKQITLFVIEHPKQLLETSLRRTLSEKFNISFDTTRLHKDFYNELQRYKPQKTAQGKFVERKIRLQQYAILEEEEKRLGKIREEHKKHSLP